MVRLANKISIVFFLRLAKLQLTDFAKKISALASRMGLTRNQNTNKW